jgi:hypothetical protein
VVAEFVEQHHLGHHGRSLGLVQHKAGLLGKLVGLHIQVGHERLVAHFAKPQLDALVGHAFAAGIQTQVQAGLLRRSVTAALLTDQRAGVVLRPTHGGHITR